MPLEGTFMESLKERLHAVHAIDIALGPLLPSVTDHEPIRNFSQHSLERGNLLLRPARDMFQSSR